MILGIDCGGTKTEAVLYKKLKPKTIIVEQAIVAKPAKKVVLFSLIKRFLRKYEGITFIGIGFPSPVIDGKVSKVNNIPGWDGCNIKEEIENKFGITCEVENDANCFALAHLYDKKYSEYKNFVAVTLGTGLGCGIIYNRKILKGKTGCAGELCKIPFMEGKLEDYTSKKFFLRKYKKEPIDIVSEASLGSKRAKKAITEFSKNLGMMAGLIINTIEPEAIIFGGNISNSFDLFNKGMNDELRKHVYKTSYDNVELIKSDIAHAAPFGAAMLSKQK